MKVASLRSSLSCVVILFGLLMPGVSSAAATHLNLTTFSGGLGVSSGSSYSLNENYVVMTGDADIFNMSVSDVVSFDWRFMSNDPTNNDFAFVISGDTFTMFADTASVRNSGGDSGWHTFEFGAPVSDLLKFAIANVGDASFNSQLEIRNVMAIPEPETYAMLLAGLLLISFSVRLNERRLCS